MADEDSVLAANYKCKHGEDCPCPVLELINGKILFVGTPTEKCDNNIAYGEGRVCTCARRNMNLAVTK